MTGQRKENSRFSDCGLHWICVGNLPKTRAGLRGSYFFALFYGFSNPESPFPTGVFPTLWITIFFLFRLRKVFKSVFHRLLKTRVDMWISFGFRTFFEGNFPAFCRNHSWNHRIFRKNRMKSTFFVFSRNFSESLENISRNSPDFNKIRTGTRRFQAIFRQPQHSFPHGRKQSNRIWIPLRKTGFF